jgi:serine/threonine protein kinase
LTQRRLFAASDTPASMALICACRVPPPSQLNPQVPRRLDQIVTRALARDPSERYSSAEAMAAELEAELERHAWGAEQTAALLRMHRQKKAYFEHAHARFESTTDIGRLTRPLSADSQLPTELDGADWLASGLAALAEVTELQLHDEPNTSALGPRPPSATVLMVSSAAAPRRVHALRWTLAFVAVALLSSLFGHAGRGSSPRALPPAVIAASAPGSPVEHSVPAAAPERTRPTVSLPRSKHRRGLQRDPRVLTPRQVMTHYAAGN